MLLYSTLYITIIIIYSFENQFWDLLFIQTHTQSIIRRSYFIMLVLLFYEPQTPVYTETFNDPLVTLRLLLYSLGGVRFWPFSNKKLCNNFSGSTEVFFYFLHPHLRSLAYSFSPQLRLTLFLSQVWANSFPPQLRMSSFPPQLRLSLFLSSSAEIKLIPFLLS